MDVNYPDQIVSLFATGIVIAAVMEARRTGKGCFLDFSQREVASFTLGEEILAASADPARRLGPRGNSEDGVAQQDAYRCKRRALDRRHARCTPIRRSTAFCAARDSDDAVAALLAKGIAAAPCNDGADLLRDTSARRRRRLVRDERGGLVKGLPYRLDGKGITIERAAPDLGQHTDEVLRELLGYDDAELAKLEDVGRDLDDAERWETSDHGARRSAQADGAHGDARHRRADVPGLQPGADAGLLQRRHHGQLPGPRHAQPRGVPGLARRDAGGHEAAGGCRQASPRPGR